MSTSDTIAIRGLRAHGYHGVLPEERQTGQPFIVDVVLAVDTTSAAASDDLGETVDYATLASALERVLVGEPVQLLETLAQRLADVCLESSLVTAVEVTVHKPQAPVGVPVEDIVVTVRRLRG